MATEAPSHLLSVASRSDSQVYIHALSSDITSPNEIIGSILPPHPSPSAFLSRLNFQSSHRHSTADPDHDHDHDHAAPPVSRPRPASTAPPRLEASVPPVKPPRLPTQRYSSPPISLGRLTASRPPPATLHPPSGPAVASPPAAPARAPASTRPRRPRRTGRPGGRPTMWAVLVVVVVRRQRCNNRSRSAPRA